MGSKTLNTQEDDLLNAMPKWIKPRLIRLEGCVGNHEIYQQSRDLYSDICAIVNHGFPTDTPDSDPARAALWEAMYAASDALEAVTKAYYAAQKYNTLREQQADEAEAA